MYVDTVLLCRGPNMSSLNDRIQCDLKINKGDIKWG